VPRLGYSGTQDEPDRSSIEARKADHLRLTASGEVDASVSPGWGDIHLVHNALPEVDLETIDLSVEFLGID
jgi:isopentenyl-diphosphate delta-isomerase